tara:strand:+ start:479 stop:670 length:192 start_codon:yes stop_codon:yes gene_type:complete
MPPVASAFEVARALMVRQPRVWGSDEIDSPSSSSAQTLTGEAALVPAVAGAEREARGSGAHKS